MAAIQSSNTIAIDCGSSSIRALSAETGKVMCVKNCALIDKFNPSEIIALGDDAKRLEGRTSEESAFVSPISYGAVADSELCAMLVLSACEKAADRRRPFDKKLPAFAINVGATRVERAALGTVSELIGAKKARFVLSPIASAYAMGVAIEKPEATCVISLGAQVTEINIISAYRVVLSRHYKFGGDIFDRAIAEHIRKKSALLVSADASESIKTEFGAVTDLPEGASYRLSGLSLSTGRPGTAVFSCADVKEALEKPFNYLISCLCDALFGVPAEFSGDILKSGICLTGGGSRLLGLGERLEKETGLKVIASKHPENDAVKGLYKLCEKEKTVRAVIEAGSAYEI